jgi:tetratricopeptide (TPR) repeat protein
MHNKRKIFVISLHRSLTRSTDALISMLGYKTMHLPKFFQGQNVMEKIRGRENSPNAIIEVLKPVIESHDSLSDVPMPTLYRQLAEEWPESLFVLVNRDPEAWARSARALLRKRKLSPFNRVQYEHYFERRVTRIDNISLLSLMGMHVKHDADVRRFFHRERREPERLCVIDAGEEQIGERISRFLGHTPRPLPHITDNPDKTPKDSVHEWLRACPDKPDARYFYAMQLLKAGEREKAKEELKKAKDMDNNHPKASELLSNIYNEEGSLGEAKLLAEDAIRKGLFRPRLYYRISRYYLKRYRLDKSLYYYLHGFRWKLTSS